MKNVSCHYHTTLSKYIKKIKMSAQQLSKLLYNFIEIKCQLLNYYKAPFNLKIKIKMADVKYK